MDKNNGIIGHVDHGSTCLSTAVIMALSMQEQKVIVIDSEQEMGRGIRPSFKEVETFEITNPYLFEPVYFEHDSNRNRKRKQERSKQKIKNKYLGKRNVFKK